MYDKSELKRAMRVARESLGLRQEDMAELIDVSQQAITQWEKGDLPSKRWDDIRKHYGIDPEDYLSSRVSGAITKSRNVAQSIGGGNASVGTSLQDNQDIVEYKTVFHRQAVELLLDADVNIVKKIHKILLEELE